MGRAESQILVTRSHLTKFGCSGELHHALHHPHKSFCLSDIDTIIPPKYNGIVQ